MCVPSLLCAQEPVLGQQPTIADLDDQFLEIAKRKEAKVGRWLQKVAAKNLQTRVPHLMLKKHVRQAVGGAASRQLVREAIHQWIRRAQRAAPDMPAYYWHELHSSYLLRLQPLQDRSAHE